MDIRECADAVMAAMQGRDHAALMALYAENVVLHSPVTAVDFVGKDAVGELMREVIKGFDTWERDLVLASERECIFVMHGRIGGQEVELAELIHRNDDGLLDDVRIFGRPMAAIAAIAGVAAPALAARKGRARGLVVSALTRGLPPMLASGDRLVNQLSR